GPFRACGVLGPQKHLLDCLRTALSDGSFPTNLDRVLQRCEDTNLVLNWEKGKKVDDDDGDDFPSPEPKTDSRSALQMKNRWWRRIRAPRGSAEPKGEGSPPQTDIRIPISISFTGKSLYSFLTLIARLVCDVVLPSGPRDTSPLHGPPPSLWKTLFLELSKVVYFLQGSLLLMGREIFFTEWGPKGNYGILRKSSCGNRHGDDMASPTLAYTEQDFMVRVADPTFLRYFIEKGVSSAAKVVRKAYPQENVGVFVQRGRGGPLSVVEYSEMDVAMTTEINQSTGRLRVCWSNIYFYPYLEFLNQVANNLEKDSVYHLAQKTIPSFHGYTMGLKLEQFIFDAFNYSASTTLFEVLREEEFAPVKNANGSPYDTQFANGDLAPTPQQTGSRVEVSPLSYYAGENLEAICRGRTFHVRIVLYSTTIILDAYIFLLTLIPYVLFIPGACRIILRRTCQV
ncbi:hypothetical protein ZWY2020_023107, partial [Hordeum vulgare]